MGSLITTFITIVLLIAYGGICSFLGIHILHFVSIPGTMIARNANNGSKIHISVGVFFSIAGQLVIYITYMAIIIGWTRYRLANFETLNLLIWIITIGAALFPIFKIHSDLRAKEREEYSSERNLTLEAISVTETCAIIGLIVFILKPGIMMFLFGWLPFI